MKDSVLQYYIVANPFVDDDYIVNLQKQKPSVNWAYVHKNINLSKHIGYTKYLLSSGRNNLVKYNLTSLAKSGESISNLNKLRTLNLDEETLKLLFLTKISELEIGIHMN